MISNHTNNMLVLILSFMLSTVTEATLYYTKKEEFKLFVVTRELRGYVRKALWATDKFTEVRIKAAMSYLRDTPANPDYISFLSESDRTIIEQIKKTLEDIRNSSIDIQEETARNFERACEALFNQGIPENLTAVLTSLQLAFNAAKSW